MDINLHNRVTQLESDLKALGVLTRNPIGTIPAALIAIAINTGVSFLEEKQEIPALNWLKEKEKILAIDIGVRLREIADYDTSRFVTMPTGVVMIGLTPAQTQQYIQTVILTESGGNQRIINEFGYAGIGQFGASALASVGLVSRTKFNAARKTGVLHGRDGWNGQKQWLTNPNNWLIQGGQTAFLNNKQLQLAAMIKLANLNIQYGYNKGALHKTDSAKKHAGFAKAAHLVGARKASNWYKYRIDSADRKGTKASKYARDGERAVTLQSQLEAKQWK